MLDSSTIALFACLLVSLFASLLVSYFCFVYTFFEKYSCIIIIYVVILHHIREVMKKVRLLSAAFVSCKFLNIKEIDHFCK